MLRFYNVIENEQFRIGCTGRTVWVFDKNGTVLAKFKDLNYAYQAAISPRGDLLAVKSGQGWLAFYSLKELALVKKFRFSRVNFAQDDGFCFSSDGKYLLNLDSGEEGSFYIGCAGGARLGIEFEVPLCSAPEGNWVEISVSGLPGGHSGGTIHLKHGNALIFLARILEATGVEVCSISGGTADNVIPSGAAATVVCQSSPEALANDLVAMAEEYKKTLGDGFGVEVTVKGCAAQEYVWESSWRKKLVHVLANIPNEVLAFSDEFNVPETSSNFAAAQFDGTYLKLKFSQRSLINARRKEATAKIISALDTR